MTFRVEHRVLVEFRVGDRVKMKLRYGNWSNGVIVPFDGRLRWRNESVPCEKETGVRVYVTWDGDRSDATTFNYDIEALEHM